MKEKEWHIQINTRELGTTKSTPQKTLESQNYADMKGN